VAISLNSCTFSGNLGRDPEFNTSKNGKPYGKFSVAVNKWDYRTNAFAERPMWLSCVMYGERASVFCDHAHKGDLVAVVGELWVRDYTNKEGKPAWYVELEVSTARILAQGLPPGKPDENREVPIDKADPFEPF